MEFFIYSRRALDAVTPHEVPFGLTRETGAEPGQLDLRDGDGICLAFHSWREGDFGTSALAVNRS